MNKFIVSLCVLFSASAMASTVTAYDPQVYLDDQYEVIQEHFSGFDVTKEEGSIVVTIPTDKGFAVGGHTLTRSVRDRVKRLGVYLNEHNESLINVYGHTDSTGSATRNEELSLQRANTVVEQLLAVYVNPYRITVKGEAAEVPKCTNASERGKACNRRVEIEITFSQMRF
ncbi:hypothetical protein A6E01_19260 (plasmid) [Vibrio breoganii]|uniref:OmpA-like domain-containing protein n=1 Tax=Vibrio breoganii TaxID=553239 RepID=A0AAN0XZ85_9VIBR|nr:OmpA family protein [Vibrio breoganii]ANO35354.1 hypothetical protein A6E01_19260 [Vibrio breoganii]PML12724.1 hypothetical protein BCT84_02245 [Vibrio breoganii]